MRPELFISLMGEVSPIVKELFQNGGCYKFYKILEAVYPNAEPYYNGDHVITKIEGEYYDVSGKVEKGDSLRMSQEEQDEAESWKTSINKSLVKMLNESALKSLSEITGQSVEDLTSAITSEKEVEINLPKGEFFTEDQLASRDKSKYEEGKLAGIEKPIKEKARELGYDMNGKGGLEAFLEVHEEQMKKKYSKGSNERIEELEKSIAKQRETYEKEIGVKQTELDSLKGSLLSQRVNNSLLSIMPKETTIDKRDVITLFSGSHSIEELDGQLVVKKDGDILRDPKTTQPISVETVFNEWVVEKKFIANNGGRGLGSQNGNGSKISKAESPEDFQREWMENNPGKSTAGQEYAKAYKEWHNSKDKAA